MPRITFPRLSTTLMKYARCIVFCQILWTMALGILLQVSVDLEPWNFILCWDPADLRSLKFVLSWDPGDLRSCGSWILNLILLWDPGDPGFYFFVIAVWSCLDPKFLFCREILEILDLDQVIFSYNHVYLRSWHSFLSSDPADLGSWFLAAAHVWSLHAYVSRKLRNDLKLVKKRV